MNTFMFTPVVAAANIAKWVGGGILAIVAIILLISLIGDAKEAGKGQGSGSMGKVVTKIIFMILIIVMGVILLKFAIAASDGDVSDSTFAGTAETIGNKISDTTKDLLEDATK